MDIVTAKGSVNRAQDPKSTLYQMIHPHQKKSRQWRRIKRGLENLHFGWNATATNWADWNDLDPRTKQFRIREDISDGSKVNRPCTGYYR
jgi:hypothetical protein